MIEPRVRERPIERRYGPEAAVEWQLVLNHFRFSRAFGLVVLAVPDSDGAELCRGELAADLAARHRSVAVLALESPGALRGLATRLLELPADAEVGAVWIAAVVPPSAADYEEWVEAWRFGLAALNQQRNPLRRQFGFPLVFVGSPWLIPIFRDTAPDLWSVRTLVVQIQPDPEYDAVRREAHPEITPQPAPLESETGAPDPVLALDEAESLRGVEGSEASRAALLERAGAGFLARRDWIAAEAALRDAVALRTSLADPAPAGSACFQFGRAIAEQGRHSDAEAVFRQALAFEEQGGASPVSRAVTTDWLGKAVHDQGRAAEAEALFRRAVLLDEEGHASAISRSYTLDRLARSIREQGRAGEAEAIFRQALALKEEGGDALTARGIVTHELARAVREQGRAAEAEALYRQALALKEEGGDSATSRGITLDELARAVRDQGRAAEAEALFRRALVLNEEGGASAISRGITLHLLGSSVRDQGRFVEAETLFRQALKLGHDGGDTPPSCGMTVHELALTLGDQGKFREAEQLFREALALKQQGGSPTTQGLTVYELARVVSWQGRLAEAESLFREGLRLFQQGDTPAAWIELTRRELDRVLTEMGRSTEGRDPPARPGMMRRIANFLRRLVGAGAGGA